MPKLPLENIDPKEVLEINLGPQHPSTHGVLRLILKLSGEQVVSCEPVIGYLHTGVEKECQTRTYHQVFTLVDRLDYLSGPAEEQVFAGAVEKLMGVEVPRRAQLIRLILLELARIASHLVWVGTSALELNMSSVYMYCFAEREKILDIMEMISGARMFPSYFRIGGVAHDLPDAFAESLSSFCAHFPKTWDDLDRLLTENYVWIERLKGVLTLHKKDCEAYMCTGPVLRASGVAHDIRRASPYLCYSEFEFNIPTEQEGDSYARYLIRMKEMVESLSILKQALKKLEPGPVLVDNRKVALPPRKELVGSMEAVIHHFKLISEGICPPIGRVHNAVESARGELGMFLISDGSNKPYHLRVRSPSFAALQTLGPFLPGHLLSDVVVAIASLDPILGDVDR